MLISTLRRIGEELYKPEVITCLTLYVVPRKKLLLRLILFGYYNNVSLKPYCVSDPLYVAAANLWSIGSRLQVVVHMRDLDVRGLSQVRVEITHAGNCMGYKTVIPLARLNWLSSERCTCNVDSFPLLLYLVPASCNLHNLHTSNNCAGTQI